MGHMWLFVLNAFAFSLIYAAPREYSTDELITKPRPGEEFVNIQTTSKDKVDLLEKSFATSHRIPQLSQTNRAKDFQTSHKIPSYVQRSARSLQSNINVDLNPVASSNWEPIIDTETKVSFSVVEGTTVEPPLERVVTKTSIKMSKSKKIHKSLLKSAHDGLIDIKSEEGFIDERHHADEEERDIMEKKLLKNEKIESSSEVLLPPTRFNVPFEEEVKINYKNKEVLIPNPVLATTQEPPITTFNYKNIYEKMKESNTFNFYSENGEEKLQDKHKYETIINESIKTAESKSINVKKDTKQEKKEKYKKEENNQKENTGFYILPVNKQQLHQDDNFDFVDVDEKILVPAGSSPSQSSRINIKKGPNGQDYEYEYVYYYYDEDEEGGGSNGGSSGKEGKTISSSTTEKVYNGHDGPSRKEQEKNFVQSTSTSGNKYLPTESTVKTYGKNKKKSTEVVEEEVVVQNSISKNSRGGGSRFTPTNKQPEPANNEVLPSSGRSGFRPRGRTSTTTTEEVTPVAEERLPSNTRFPPRFRSNNAQVTSPQPQETTARTRSREGNGQSRLRIPNSSLLDSSSFRTHSSSDASLEEEAIREEELHRKSASRGQSHESSGRRGGRPSTFSPVSQETSDIPVSTRRPSIRRPKVPIENEEKEESQEKVSPEEHEIAQNLPFEPAPEQKPQIPLEEAPAQKPRVPLENDEQPRPRVPLEEEQPLKPRVPLEDEQEVSRPEVPVSEAGIAEQQTYVDGSSEVQRRPETTRESDAEEGVFENQHTQTTSEHTFNEASVSEGRTVVPTTEDQSAIGLTGAMMEKVALDLYAILQQTQNENIQTNFIDGNSTDITTNLGEGSTEFSTLDDDSTPEPLLATTASTTTTTTTPAPTTTTTTTPTPTQAPGRGRYRTRVPGGAKGRSKVASTTTTEAPEEVSTQKTRGRFQPNHAVKTGPSYGRKPLKPTQKEVVQDESPAEEAPKASPERTFGGRNRFRSSAKVAAAPSSAAPPSPPSAPAAASPGATRGGIDRFHLRRRGGIRGGLPTATHHTEEGAAEEEKHDALQENTNSSEEPSTPAPAIKPTRPRIGGVRPLRPGLRVPLVSPQRGNATPAPSTTAAPTDNAEAEKEQGEQEATQQHVEEPQEQPTTPVGDALSRLKNRPRLRIGANAPQHKLQTPVPPPANRRKLVSSLLPRRKPEDKPVDKVEEVEEKIEEEVPTEQHEAVAPAEESSSTSTEPETKNLPGLLGGRRRNLNRRPGLVHPRPQPVEA